MSQTVPGLRLAVWREPHAGFRAGGPPLRPPTETEKTKSTQETDSGQMVADTHIQWPANSENDEKMLDKFN